MWNVIWKDCKALLAGLLSNSGSRNLDNLQEKIWFRLHLDIIVSMHAAKFSPWEIQFRSLKNGIGKQKGMHTQRK